MRPGSHAGWHKSSYSDQGNGCVEVRVGSGLVEIRDTKLPRSPVIPFTEGQWVRWLREVIAECFTGDSGVVDVRVGRGTWTVHSRATGDSLTFDPHEWEAFRLGAIDGEFDVRRQAAHSG